MKKIIAASALLMGSSYLMAAGGHGPAGCGLGTAVVFKNPTQWHEHVLAATTNGTSGNQTFGMTSGTLGCKDANGPLAGGPSIYFDKNMDQIAADSAQGEGESLEVLAALIGIEQADQAAFNQMMQNNFDSIFASSNVTSGIALEQLAVLMSTDVTLKKYLG
ncbi:MAG: DUF3015 domain-containing protein [Pseudomonadales bacterium]|nr:DUF3015 domain-containing protein [Pseudomonadales bacterium]